MVSISMVAPEKQMRSVVGLFDRKARRRISDEVHQSVEEHGIMLWMELQANSPWDTGAYALSWQLMLRRNVAVATNNSPQALRLEFGYVGIDSLGRHYAQAPQPHITPSYMKVANLMYDDMERILREVVG